MSVELRSSQGKQHQFILPEQSELQTVMIDGAVQPIRLENRTLTFPVHPGKQTIKLSWRQPSSIKTLFVTPQVNLGLEHVNQRIHLQLGYDRWVLLVGGPTLGPAVLIWGVLLLMLLAAIVLGRLQRTPLNTFSWLLLGVGLTQASVVSLFIVVGWLLALDYRHKMPHNMPAQRFNIMQIGYVILTGLALFVLVLSVQRGLLGLPKMMVVGNHSTAYQMNWYQDRGLPDSAQAWVFSLSIMIYRLLMLAWALWLALALVKWLKWAWICFTTHGIWQKSAAGKPKNQDARRSAEPAGEGAGESR